MSLATNLLVWGTLAHWVADWPLQNSWMAINKVKLTHPAAWVHGLIHFGMLALVFPLPFAAGLAVAHMLIDTRVPLDWWRKIFHFTADEPMRTHVAIWLDQIAHIISIGIAALIVGYIETGEIGMGPY